MRRGASYRFGRTPAPRNKNYKLLPLGDSAPAAMSGEHWNWRALPERPRTNAWPLQRDSAECPQRTNTTWVRQPRFAAQRESTSARLPPRICDVGRKARRDKRGTNAENGHVYFILAHASAAVCTPGGYGVLMCRRTQPRSDRRFANSKLKLILK